jgi:hypothetical protein
MSRILELINEWKDTICTESRWREDLGNIRDMWRLLNYKGKCSKVPAIVSSYEFGAGYRFKERRREGNAPSTSVSPLIATIFCNSSFHPF